MVVVRLTQQQPGSLECGEQGKSKVRARITGSVQCIVVRQPYGAITRNEVSASADVEHEAVLTCHLGHACDIR